MEEDLGWGGFRFTGYDRHAIIAALADFCENWDLSEERHTLPAGFVLPHGYVEGLYERHGGKLYVNRGFGTAGPPARLGAAPEITRVILTRA